jgi:hypothetical protein
VFKNGFLFYQNNWHGFLMLYLFPHSFQVYKLSTTPWPDVKADNK